MSTNVVISYSRRDQEPKDRLRLHLGRLEKAGIIKVWDDKDIKPGEEWKPAIEQAINAAKIAVPLISVHYCESDFILKNELPLLLDRAESERLHILPVRLSPCQIPRKFERLNDLQIIKRGKPLNDLSEADQERVWVKLAARIEEIATTDDAAPTSDDDELNSKPSALGRWGRCWPSFFGALSTFGAFVYFRIEKTLKGDLEWYDILSYQFLLTLLSFIAVSAIIGRLFIHVDQKRINQPKRFLFGMAVAVLFFGVALAAYGLTTLIGT